VNRLPLLIFGLLCGCVMGAGSEVVDAQDIPQSSSQTLEDDFETVGQDFDDLIIREREAILESEGIGDAVLGPELDPGQAGEIISLEDLVDVGVEIRGIPTPPSASGSGQQDGQSGEQGQDGEQGEQGEQGEGDERGEGDESGDQSQSSGEGGGQPGGYQPGGAGGSEEEGGDQTPDDIPDGQDDDIVARQLRELAENETDPELQERLWEEYRKYRAEN
jgi:hypothetical protein